MKKTICILSGAVFGIAIYWLGFVNGVYYSDNKTEVVAEENTALSDEECLNKYVEERYGIGRYADVFSMSDGYIYYDVYSEDGRMVNSLCTTYVSLLRK